MTAVDTSLEDATVLITGAASGIGLATVEEFLDCDATVVAADVEFDRDPAKLDSAEWNINDEVKEVFLDVREQSKFRELVRLITEHIGDLDILVNNAGVGGPRAFEETTTRQLENILDVNLIGVWNGCKAVVPELLNNQGNIINVTSIAATQGVQGYTAYAASKGAVLSLTHTLADEFGKYGTRVNAVAPGTIDTSRISNHTRAMLNKKRDPRLRSVIPLKRTGNPREVAKCIRFLASPDAAYVTGTELTVDGGRSSTGP